MFSVTSVCTQGGPCTGLWPCRLLYWGLAPAPPDIFKHVQLGSHCTKTPPRACSNLFTMMDGLSAVRGWQSNEVPFCYYVYLISICNLTKQENKVLYLLFSTMLLVRRWDLRFSGCRAQLHTVREGSPRTEGWPLLPPAPSADSSSVSKPTVRNK